jgi:hypothetical protein
MSGTCSGNRNQPTIRAACLDSGLDWILIAICTLPIQMIESVAAVAAGAHLCRVITPTPHTSSAMPLPQTHGFGLPSHRGTRLRNSLGRTRWITPEAMNAPATILVPHGSRIGELAAGAASELTKSGTRHLFDVGLSPMMPEQQAGGDCQQDRAGWTSLRKSDVSKNPRLPP